MKLASSQQLPTLDTISCTVKHFLVSFPLVAAAAVAVVDVEEVVAVAVAMGFR